MCVKMKFFVMTLLIVICQNEYVTCTFLDFMASKFSDLATSLTSTIINLRDQVKMLFLGPIRPTPPSINFIPQPPGEETKKTFAEFVETTAAENESELPEYTRMKSEPTALMSTPQLALFHGRRVESHAVTTLDGYILTLHRISPTPSLTHKFTNHTVILHHGLLGSSADWILLGRDYSLPYMLSDVGYDVWMLNARGNYYSRGHIRKNIDSPEFWRFSWQEMGEIDLAAVIDYVRLIKNFSDQNSTTEKIDYIGHSMGATALLVLLSQSPKYNMYLRIGVLLAPLAYMTNVDGPLKAMMTMATNPPEQLLKLMGPTEFVPSRRIPKWVALKYCSGPILFCCNPLYFITGGIHAASTRNSSYVARLLYHVPAGGSTGTILHYAQLALNGKFHRFNDVTEEFQLNQITMPIALISSDDDWLATIPDVLRLYFSILNPIDHYIIRGKNFSHTEFVFSPEAKEIVFDRILEYLDSGINWHMAKRNEIHSGAA